MIRAGRRYTIRIPRCGCGPALIRADQTAPWALIWVLVSVPEIPYASTQIATCPPPPARPRVPAVRRHYLHGGHAVHGEARAWIATLERGLASWLWARCSPTMPRKSLRRAGVVRPTWARVATSENATGRLVAASSAQAASTRAKDLPRVDPAKVLAAAEIGHPPDVAGAALPRTSTIRRRERRPVEEES